jgi:hypothetical protein
MKNKATDSTMLSCDVVEESGENLWTAALAFNGSKIQ